MKMDLQNNSGTIKGLPVKNPQYEFWSETLNRTSLSLSTESEQNLKTFHNAKHDYCRLCLSVNNLTVKMFHESPGELSPEAKVFLSVNMKLIHCDGLPDVICEECVLRADMILYFTSWHTNLKKQYLEVQKLLQQLISTQTEERNTENVEVTEKHKTEPSIRLKENTHVDDEQIFLSSNSAEIVKIDRLFTGSVHFNEQLQTINSNCLGYGVIKTTKIDQHINEKQDGNKYLQNSAKNSEVSKISPLGEDEAFISVNQKMSSNCRENYDIPGGSREIPSCLDLGSNSTNDASLPNSSVLKASETDKFVCFCGKSYSHVSTLNKHISTHGNNLFKCPECDAQYKRKEYLLKHLMSHEDVKSKYQCETCNRRFVSTHLLDKHTRAHMGMKPYKCDKCGRYFSQKNLLESHLNWHTGTKGHLCEICGQTFFSLQNLKVHIKDIHSPSKLKKFECSICQKKFHRKYHLDCHVLVHTDSRPHQCKTCGMTFKRLSQLTEHKRIHTGEKLYKCDKCDKSFTTKRVLNVHKVIHFDLKKHHCCECSRMFARRNGLLVHMKTHLKDKVLEPSATAGS